MFTVNKANESEISQLEIRKLPSRIFKTEWDYLFVRTSVFYNIKKIIV